MDFDQILDRAIEMLQRRRRMSYRALKRQFDLDDAYLDDLTFEITKVQQCAVDQDGELLIWTGDPATPETHARHRVESERRFQALMLGVTMLLQRDQRVTYRTLKYVFGIDETRLSEIRRELRLRRLAVDEEGEVLVWIGEMPNAQSASSFTRQENTASAAATIVSAPSVPQHHLTATAIPTHGQPASPEQPPVESPSDEQPTASELVHSPPEAERRQLTVMFCDLVGSTDLSGRLDPEDLREVVKAYQETAAEVVTHYEGHIAQYLGDGLLIYFGYPVAHEDDPQRAVHTGLGIIDAMGVLNTRLEANHHEQLTVRIGIHTGPVVVGEMGSGSRQENLALGETPNIAARLEGFASSNSVVISPVTARLVQQAFVLEELGVYELKGVSEPMVVAQVIGRLEPETTGPAMLGFDALIGRDEEIGLMLRRWKQAVEGLGQVVLLSGEAGIGKSSLVEGLRHHVRQEGFTLITFRCSPYHTNSPLYPIIEQTQRALDWQPDDSTATKLAKLERRLHAANLIPEEAVPSLSAMLSLPLPEGRYPTRPLSPEQQRQQTIDILVAWLIAEAENQPVLAVWEDLHWADHSTIEALGRLIDQAPTATMLNLLAFRPEFEPPWTARSHLTPITLNRLERPQAEVLITRLSGAKGLPDEVVAYIATKTDGVPLYVEALTKMLLASDVLREETDHYELTGSLSSVAIPDTLQDSLMARLDQMQEAKEVAQLGAVLGREFSHAMLQSLSALDASQLQARLARVVHSELLYQRGRPPQATYIFKHALIQDAAYASLLRSTRHRIHREVAQLLESQYPEVVDRQPELVAHHYAGAECIEAAVTYLQKAARRATRQAAYHDAIAHLMQALSCLSTLPDTPERAQCELDLQLSLGTPLMVAKGYAGLEVEHAFSRARELCQILDRPQQLISVLHRGWIMYLNRGNLDAAYGLADQLLSLAEDRHDDTTRMNAMMALGITRHHQGRMAQALPHFEAALALYVPSLHRSPRVLQDTQVTMLAYLAWSLGGLGYLDRAAQQLQKALILATELAHPNTLAAVRYYAANCHMHRQDWTAVRAEAEVGLPICQEYGLTVFQGILTLYHGYAMVKQGQAEGLSEMQCGQRTILALGHVLCRPMWHGFLADAYMHVGQIDAGLATLDEAFEIAATIGEHDYEAELHRLHGVMLFAQSSDHIAEAEICFRQAIDVAVRQQAKLWELRASSSLARLWQRQGKRDEARELLAPVYEWFAEGLDTADLQNAKALLDELAG